MSLPEPQSRTTLADRGYSNVTAETLLLIYRDRADELAFNELVHRFEREIFNYLYRYLRNRELAEEAFQATFLRLHEKCHLYEPGRQVRPWLYSIATSQAIDLLRREGRHTNVSLDEQRGGGDSDMSMRQMLASDEPGPLAEMQQLEVREWTRQSVDKLPPHLRVVVLMVFFQGLKYREAAAALDLPVGTVKSRMHKALVQLHSAWKQDHPDAELEDEGSLYDA